MKEYVKKMSRVNTERTCLDFILCLKKRKPKQGKILVETQNLDDKKEGDINSANKQIETPNPILVNPENGSEDM